MLEIFRYDDRSLRLQGGRQDMRVLWVWQSLTDFEKPVEVNDHRVLEGGLHLLPCARSAIGSILEVLLRQDVFNCLLRLIENGCGPAKAEEFRLGQTQEQVPI